VVLAVGQPHPEVDHRVTGQVAAPPRLLDALLDRRPVALGDRAAEDLVDEMALILESIVDVLLTIDLLKRNLYMLSHLEILQCPIYF
jgi:hypothetical protein